MLKVTLCDDGTFLVYKNRKYIGLILANDLKGKVLYQAIDKTGHILGTSTLYGEVLKLVLAVPHGIRYYAANGDD